MESKNLMPRTKFYTKEQLEETRRLLQQAALRGPREPNRYTRQQLFEQVTAEYEELRRQGFSNIEIAEIASQGLGEALGAPALQKMFTPPKRRKRKKGDDDITGGSKTPTRSPIVPRSGNVSSAEPHRKSPEAAPHDTRYLRERS
jgi:hypothetical protein